MIDETFHSRHKLTGAGQFRVKVERDLIDPMRMEVEQLRLTDRGKYVNGATTCFPAHVPDLLTQKL